MVLISLMGFTLVYGALMVADVYLLPKYAKAGSPTASLGEPRSPPMLAGEDDCPSLVLSVSSVDCRAKRSEAWSTMDLNTLWFILIAVLYIGFFVLEGFDFGVGILLPFLSKDKDPQEPRTASAG